MQAYTFRRIGLRTNALAAEGCQDAESDDVQPHAAVLLLQAAGNCAHKLALTERCTALPCFT